MSVKYPKTYHIEDDFEALYPCYSRKHGNVKVVAEEKMDGTQVSIRFDFCGNVKIPSRGNYVSSEVEFSRLKS